MKFFLIYKAFSERKQLLWVKLQISSGPRLRPIDKGGKELIKFYRLSSDKAEFYHFYVDTSQCVKQRSESIIKVTKIFPACAVYTILPFVTYRS